MNEQLGTTASGVRTERVPGPPVSATVASISLAWTGVGVQNRHFAVVETEVGGVGWCVAPEAPGYRSAGVAAGLLNFDSDL